MDNRSQTDFLDLSQSILRQKIVIVGDVAVGKTALILRFIENRFKENYDPSIGVDFSSKVIKYQGRTLKLQLWDSAGQEKYRSLIPSYVKGSALVFLVYDVTSKIFQFLNSLERETFDHLKEWLNFIKDIENPIIVILGNKVDLASNRVISKQEAENFANKENLLFFEVSAKEDINIKYAFNYSITELPFFKGDANDTTDRQMIDKEELINEIESDSMVSSRLGEISFIGPSGTNVSILKPPHIETERSGCKC